MKKIISFLCALTLAFTLTSCKKEPVPPAEISLPETDAVISASATSVALINDGVTVKGALEEYGEFSDISNIYMFEDFIIAIKNDKTLDIRGELNKPLEEIRNWTDIVKISGTSNFMAGLKADGTVVAAGDNSYGQCDVSEWKDIVDISASGGHTVGLKKDKTCVAVGRNDNQQCNVDKFKNIKIIAAVQGCTIGVYDDGTAISVGKNRDDIEDITYYSNIKSVSAYEGNAIILQNDGKVRFFGYKSKAANPDDWQNIIKVCASPIGYYGIDNTGKILYVGDSTFAEKDNGSSEIIKNKVTVK